MRVLIIEDDKAVVDTLKAILKSEDYTVEEARTGEDGFDIARFYEYDLILLDLVLPDMDGHELLRRLRASKIKTPVLILSGLKETTNIIKGIDDGADDYLTKPFDKQELLARIRAIVRRSQGHADSVIRVGDLSVDLSAHQAEVNGKRLRLTVKEYGILELLVMRVGSTLSKEMFLNHLYGGIDEPELKIIDVFVCKLRKKIADALGTEDENYIETVWGRGYVLRDPKEAERLKKGMSADDLVEEAKQAEAQKVAAAG